jgi:hypothetical protein
MKGRLIALVAFASLLFSGESAVTESQPVSRPTAKQVFLYVEIIDNNFATNKAAAVQTLQEWLEGGKPSYSQSTLSENADSVNGALQLEKTALSFPISETCGECLYKACPNYNCDLDKVRKCIETACQ